MGRLDFVQNLAPLLNSPRWRQCPVWISGRHEAFKKESAKELFQGMAVRVLKVDPLAKPEIGFFVKCHAGRDWHDDFPHQKYYRPELNLIAATDVVSRAFHFVGSPEESASHGVE
jgi:hypothetical protein